MTKRKNAKSGFATVYLLMIMSTLLALILAIVEVSAGYAAGSIAESNCLIAGRSVLSEFQPKLYDRYGILALRNDKDILSKLASFYINGDDSGSIGLVKISLENMDIRTEDYQGTNKDLLEKQIEEIGMYITAKNVLDEVGLTQMVQDILSGKASENYTSGEAEESLSQLAAPPEGENESDTSRKRRRQARELKQKYTNAMEGYSKKDAGSIFKNFTAATKRDFLTCEYILSVCSNRLEPFSDTVLLQEAEYVAFGKSTDNANEVAMEDYLFGLRFSINLAGIYANPQEMALVAEEAAAFPLLPYPLVVFVLSCIRAAVDAKAQIGILKSGGKVKLIQSVDFGSYEDYLLLFLLTVSQPVKLTRLMNLMEQNLVEIDKATFSFETYCYGFDMNAVFSKKTHLPEFMGIVKRNCTISQSHAYK